MTFTFVSLAAGSPITTKNLHSFCRCPALLSVQCLSDLPSPRHCWELRMEWDGTARGRREKGLADDSRSNPYPTLTPIQFQHALQPPPLPNFPACLATTFIRPLSVGPSRSPLPNLAIDDLSWAILRVKTASVGSSSSSSRQQ